jgi:LEA14-like dessication related protein
VPILTLGLAIQNPSNTPFRVKSIVGTLTSNGIPLANVSAYDDKVIAASSETVYPLKFRLSLIGIATDIVKIFTGGGIAQQIEFKGGVNVNNSLQELEFKYTIG